MRSYRKSISNAGEAVLSWTGLNASAITSGNVGLMWLSASDVSVTIEAFNSSDVSIFSFNERNPSCTGLRRDPGANVIQIAHTFPETADTASITVVLHEPMSISSLQIFDDINDNNWIVNSVEDINKLKNLTLLAINYPITMTPDLTQLESLTSISIRGTDESTIDVRYARLKSLTALSFGPTWVNGVSNDMSIINTFTNLTALSISQHYLKALSATEDYLLNFTAESQILNITAFGYSQVYGHNTDFPDRLKHLVNLENFSVNEKSNQASYSINLEWPLLNDTDNDTLRNINLYGLWGTNCEIITWPNVDRLIALEELNFTYMFSNSTKTSASMERFYIWFFTKIWNPASGHIHHNSALASETFIHPAFRSMYIQPKFIPVTSWDNRDKYQEIDRVPGFTLNAHRILQPLTLYTPVDTDWDDTTNVDVTAGSTITKTSGGDVHNTGGGFFPLAGTWNDFTFRGTPSSDTANMFLGLVDSAQSTIDHTEYIYGIYFRDDSTSQVQIWGNNGTSNGSVLYQIDMATKTDKLWWITRENGIISYGYDSTTVYTHNTSADYKLETTLKLMISIYTENSGFTAIAQLN